MAFGDIVQTATPSDPTTTFAVAPTLGNTLVFLGNHRGGAGSLTPPSTGTWTLVRIEACSQNTLGDGPTGIWYRHVQAGDGTSWGTIGSNMTWWRIVEVEGHLILDSSNGYSGHNTTDPTTTLTPAAGLAAVLFSICSVADDSIDFAFTPVSGMTEILETPNPQQIAINTQVISSTSGTYTVGSTYAHNIFGNSCVVGVAFTGTPIPPAPGVILDVGGTILDTAVKKSIRVDLDGTGVGQFEINRYDANATPAVLSPGALVKVTIPRIDPNPIFSFFVENSGIKLVSSDEHGGENIQITGNGGLSYLGRAIWLAQSFIINWWPATMATPPAGTKGAVIVKPGTYRHYTIAGGVITGYANFTTAAGFSAYFDSRKTYDWPSQNSKRFLVHLTTTEDPASPDYTGYYFHPHQDGVTEYLPSYQKAASIPLTQIGDGDKPGQVLYRIYQEAVSASRPIHPVPALTVDFTDTLDSAGNAWTTTNALVGVTADLGETYLTTIGKLLGTGVLDVVMGPDLVMHAYNHYGRTLTGTTFGAGKVRFVKGVNIADELTRELNPQPVPTWTEVIGTNDVTAQQALTSSYPPREVSVRGETDDTTALAALGLAELTRQRVQVDAVGFRVTAIGDDEASGTYLPGPPGSAHGKYWIGDTVTLHTGTAGQDFNQADERVAAVTIAEDDAANLEVTVEVGSALGGGNGLLASAGSSRLGVVASTIATTVPVEGSLSTAEVVSIADTEAAAAITTHDGLADPHTGYVLESVLTTQDDIIVRDGTGPARLGKGSDGQVLTVDPTTHHLVWATPGGGSSPLTTKGDIHGFTTVDARVAVGTNGQYLKADSTQSSGLAWDTPAGSGTLTTVEEVDGSPTDSAVTKIVFPNGTLAIAAHVATYTPAGGSSDLVQTNSGAGSVYVPGLRGSPDAKPASPASADDEFEALSGWTTLGTLDTSNVSDAPSHWHVKRTNGAVALDGIYKTAPSMPFTVTCKLASSNLIFGTNYNFAGILLTEASPGKCCTFGIVDNGTNYWVSLYRWTNRTTLATNIDAATNRPIVSPMFQYIRLVVTSSTSVTGYFSDDGLMWLPIGTISAVTTGLTVANVGLAIGDAAASGTVEAWFDWIRFT